MTLPLHANLSYRLSIIGFLLGRQTSQLYARHSLGVQEWKVLSVVFHHGPLPAVEIEGWVTLDKSAISRAVAQLLQAGLVKRRPRADDARAADILLTPAGRRLSRRITDKTEALQTRLLEAIPTADRQRLFDTLDALEAALRQGPPASGADSVTRAKRAKGQADT